MPRFSLLRAIGLFLFSGVAVAPLCATPFRTPVSYDEADRRASALLERMTTEQKLALIHGHNAFFIRGFPELGIPELYMSDATQGIHIRPKLPNQMARSTAFPSPIALAATWNPDLAYRYAYAVGEECRAGGIAILLAPGVNIYRQAQNGRSFEYFGEDPFLASRIAERYVRGVLDTGTLPTVKHFLANNTEFYRRISNSIVDERAQREIYLPAFKAAIDAGVMAVMTSYNQVNGEWTGESYPVITQLLRNSLGFKWLVMTDWGSIRDPAKTIRSGQDLEMPGDRHLKAHARRLLEAGEVNIGDINRMVRSILRTCIAMGLHDRPLKDESYLSKFPEHEAVSLETAREGIVLLKNNGVLPLRPTGSGSILVTGKYVDEIARGGGSAAVEGYAIVTLRQALSETYGARVEFVSQPSEEQLKAAAAVVYSVGTFDSEMIDRPFALPRDEEAGVLRAVNANSRTIVVVSSGGGIRMTDWNDKAAAIVYAWYPGQIGNRALAEILAGATNPSGKLPMTIEREWKDSPGYGYIPEGWELYPGRKGPLENDKNVYPIHYHEGVLVGYRWYEKKRIQPLYAFGSGLSYTTFSVRDARASRRRVAVGEAVDVTCTVTNTGAMAGAETVQVYVRPLSPPLLRPEKELKAFAKVRLAPGETRDVTFHLPADAFSFWDPVRRNWTVHPDRYEFRVGVASDQITAVTDVQIE